MKRWCDACTNEQGLQTGKQVCKTCNGETKIDSPQWNDVSRSETPARICCPDCEGTGRSVECDKCGGWRWVVTNAPCFLEVAGGLWDGGGSNE